METEIWSREPGKVRVEFKFIDEYVGEYVDKDGNAQKLPKLPYKSSHEDAGYDVTSAESGLILPGESMNFHSGVRVACPLGWFYSIRGRSGLGFKGIQPFIGTLDATYNGQLRVLLFNFGNQPYQVNKGDRIAQIIFERQVEMDPVQVEEFSKEYDKRGTKGFGSSGKN